MTARRLLGGLLAGVVASAGLLVSPAVAATGPAPTVVVAPQGGGILRQGRDLTIDVRITNTTSTALAAGDLAFSMDQQPIASSSTLLEKLAQPPEELQGYLIPKADEEVPALAPGASATVRTTVSAKDLANTVTAASGARLVYVRYRSATDATKAIGQSVVVRMGASARPIGFGVVVPVLAPANATGVVDTAEQQALTDPGGAWDAAVRAAESAPWATVALDPEVLASIRLAGGAAPPAAQDLLRRLQHLPNQVVELPYGDGDVTLQRAAGAGAPLGPTSFAGTSVVTADGGTGATPQPTATAGAAGTTVQDLTAWGWSDLQVAWPVPGTTTGADAGALAKAGDTLLLSSTDVADTAARRAAGPSARIGGAKALVADASASALLVAAAGRGPTGGAALARLVGVLATDAVSGDAAAVLAVVGRSSEADGIGRAFSLLGSQPWIDGRSLADLAAATGPATVGLRPLSTAPARVATAKALLAGDREVLELGSAVTAGAATVTGPQRLALLGTLSAAWRGDDTAWAAAAVSVQQRFAALGNAISIPTQTSGSNAIGTDGRLQVSVKNDLDVPVQVVVHATVSNGRLQFTGKGVEVAVPANATNKGQLAFKSITNGSTRVTLSLTTPSGAPIGKAAERDVQVSAGFDTIVAVVLLGALALLLALGVYRNVKRRRQPPQRAVAAA
ncbi:DUF6049 family protein [uncultured Amnibacterium sp.]|uniref:DUF6049 family protein n=1 Tax=uncultured Amnibacterium sp. TaxID=1631851 RepID=UPI0035CBAD6B